MTLRFNGRFPYETTNFNYLENKKRRNLCKPIPVYIKELREIIEDGLGEKLSLGERMILRKCVVDSYEGLKRVTTLMDAFNIDEESIARYRHITKYMN